MSNIREDVREFRELFGDDPVVGTTVVLLLLLAAALFLVAVAIGAWQLVEEFGLLWVSVGLAIAFIIVRRIYKWVAR